MRLRIAAAIFGLLLFSLVIVVGVGAVLPKGHSATRVIELSRPPEEVWEVLTDFEGQAAWRTDITAVRRKEGASPETWIEAGPNGEMPLATTEAVAPRRLVRTIADPSLPFGGTWTYELTPSGSGTKLTITEDGEVYNPVFRFVSHYFLDQSATIERVMRALAAHFKEPARISAPPV
jgi:hypothetical protein